MKSRFSASILAALLTTTAALAQTPAPKKSAPKAATPAATHPGPKTAGETFKNVTTSTLKGLTVDDFLGAMGVMAGALAWDCSNCHPGAGFDAVNWVSDKMPTKVIARRMIEMVATINKTNFSGAQKITCWTCHRGQETPATELTLDKLYGTPNEEPETVIPRDPKGTPPDQILDKYISALGGAQALSGLTSFIATGTQNGGYTHVQGGGRFQIFARAPDQRTVTTTFPESPERGDQTRAFNGEVGWINTPRSVLGEYEVTGTELDGQKLEAELAFPGQIKTVLTNLRTGYDDNINDHPVHVVQGTGPRGLLATLYFDKETGLLRRLIRYGKTPVGRISTQVDYYDYRDVNGIKFPFAFTFSWLDGRDGFQLTEVKTNVPIDQAVFGRPKRAVKN
jgi:photosynthetic reaction center cytochrome c subunit